MCCGMRLVVVGYHRVIRRSSEHILELGNGAATVRRLAAEGAELFLHCES